MAAQHCFLARRYLASASCRLHNDHLVGLLLLHDHVGGGNFHAIIAGGAARMVEWLARRSQLIHVMAVLVVAGSRPSGSACCRARWSCLRLHHLLLRKEHALAMVRVVVRVLLLGGRRCVRKIEAGLCAERRGHPRRRV